ncbi:MAG TPA: restriction endonuclease [Phycisphaerae bacterium]|nr:restriction endonuclease [Phycisphaerales bacterium]HRX87302.1 restriction endonuclease [Phycisphaerae bacterium]
MTDDQERLQAAAEQIRNERRLALPSQPPKTRRWRLTIDPNHLVAFIVVGMIAVVFAGLIFYVLVHYLGIVGACIIVTAPAWIYGLRRAWANLAERRRARRVRAAERAAEAYRQQQEGLRRAAGDQRNRLIRELKSLAEPRLMVTLTPGDFERFVLQYFEVEGYRTQATGAVADGGIDGVLRRNNQTHFVQCKRYLDAVGEPPIRDFLGTVTKHRAHHGFFVTSSTFTPGARAFAEGTIISLVDGETLARKIRALQCLDPQTAQPVDLPLFNSDHWHEFSFVRREKSNP